MLCIPKGWLCLNLVAPNFVSVFFRLEEGRLVPNVICSKSVMRLVPLCPPSVWGISFYFNNGMMSFRVFVVNFSSILLWVSSGFNQFLMLTSVTTTGISCPKLCSFDHVWGWGGLWWEDLVACHTVISIPTSSFQLLGASLTSFCPASICSTEISAC